MQNWNSKKGGQQTYSPPKRDAIKRASDYALTWKQRMESFESGEIYNTCKEIPNDYAILTLPCPIESFRWSSNSVNTLWSLIVFYGLNLEQSMFFSKLIKRLKSWVKNLLNTTSKRTVVVCFLSFSRLLSFLKTRFSFSIAGGCVWLVSVWKTADSSKVVQLVWEKMALQRLKILPSCK